MAKSSVREKLEEYFSSMTPTSSRFMADIKNLKQGFNCNWEELNHEQQNDMLWNAIVKPEAIKMYQDIPENSLNVEYFPVLRIRPGAKIIVEDDNVSTKSFGNSWRDEHSSPFCWETMSQLGLDDDETEEQIEQTAEKTAEVSDASCIPTSTENQETDKEATPKKTEPKKEEEVKKSTIKRPEVPPPPVPPHASPPVPPHVTPSPPPPQNETPIYAKVMKRKSLPKTLGSTELKALRKQRDEAKPAVPPRMSLELKGSIDVTKYKTLPIDIDDFIPKTGFDFLDNW
ncbi:uncharacterized protein C1orf198 homolog [Parasteatoda tepidariorum]|uniref:uncharacterized protein C1orf198 homolog n=1 Tax=Parasteatoda tepidariorum TaxID=114398 RepID=UPI00077FE013|nr:uncharacterized protein C1orf198 homolog [Parasteatoda tepidariorum]